MSVRARDVAAKVALGVLVGGAVAHFLGLLYRRHHLLTALPGPEARTLSAKGHEEELKKVKAQGWYDWELVGDWNAHLNARTTDARETHARTHDRRAASASTCWSCTRSTGPWSA